jgi:hypothetical protein
LVYESMRNISVWSCHLFLPYWVKWTDQIGGLVLLSTGCGLLSFHLCGIQFFSFVKWQQELSGWGSNFEVWSALCVLSILLSIWESMHFSPSFKDPSEMLLFHYEDFAHEL